MKEVKAFEQKFQRTILQENNDFNHDIRSILTKLKAFSTFVNNIVSIMLLKY